MKKPTREQVRAWLGVVVAPILDRLRLEEYFLTRHNPSWRFRGETFEYLRPIHEYVRLEHGSVVDQFCRYQRRVARLFERHNLALDRLHPATRDLYLRLLAMAELRELAAAIEAEFPDWRGAYGPEDGPALLAETTINWMDLGNPAEHYPTAAPWRKHRDDGLRILGSDELAETRATFQSALADLRDVVTQLIDRMIRTRDDLADSYGIPPVPIQASGTAPIEFSSFS